MLTTIERVRLNAAHLRQVPDDTLNLCIEDAHEMYIAPHLGKVGNVKLEIIERFLAIHFATLNIRRPDNENLTGVGSKSVNVPKGEDLEQTEYGQTAKKLAKQLGLDWAESADLKKASVKIY
jgi:hypothetical protein